MHRARSTSTVIMLVRFSVVVLIVVDIVVWSCFFISVWMCDRKDSKSCLMDEMVALSSGVIAGEGLGDGCVFMFEDMVCNCLILLRSSF